ncbi:MAG: TerB family tellurite resistance protein [Alphaproteobacteria bacterium]|nr:TerB family tellurite resistance protein [Alphaproteobacteria bacterium]
MSGKLNESRFYMWRAVVAMVHADGVVTPHEMFFVSEHTKSLDFSPEQNEIFLNDLKKPQSVDEMFARITHAQDRKDFFSLARALSWCDGDFDAQEKAILERLEELDSVEKELLEESRDIVNELELCDKQWKAKTERAQNLLGFLKILKAA